MQLSLESHLCRSWICFTIEARERCIKISFLLGGRSWPEFSPESAEDYEVADLMAFDAPTLRSRRNSVLARQNTCPLPLPPPSSCSRRHSLHRQRTSLDRPTHRPPQHPASPLHRQASVLVPDEPEPPPLVEPMADAEAPCDPVELVIDANACASPPTSDFNSRASNLSTTRASGHQNASQSGSKRGTLGRSYSSTDAPSDDKVGECHVNDVPPDKGKPDLNSTFRRWKPERHRCGPVARPGQRQFEGWLAERLHTWKVVDTVCGSEQEEQFDLTIVSDW